MYTALVHKPKLIAIVGPTGSGKSALGAYLAKRLGGEVVAADSRQVYKGMRIISRAGREHMVGIANPKEQYSAGEYVKKASAVLATIYRSNNIPVVVGGTGLYIDMLLGRMSMPEVPPNKKLRRQLERLTLKQLAARLRRLDPALAKRVDPHNKVRLVRAIEIAKSPTPQQDKNVPRYNVLWLGLRKQKNLKAGVEARLRAGMVAEAKKLRSTLSKKRYAELGFEFALLASYIDRQISKKELVGALVHGEQKYAKRQWRWFKRNKSICWVAGNREALQLAKEFAGGR